MEPLVSEASLERLIQANRDASERLDAQRERRPLDIATREVVTIEKIINGHRHE